MTDINERVRVALEQYDGARWKYAALNEDEQAELRNYEDWEDAQLNTIDTFVEASRELLTSIVLPTKPLDEGYILGLRAGWLQGDDGNGLEFDLDSGAGFGNPMLSMSVKFPDGGRVTETVDMRIVATDWVNRIRSEYKGVQRGLD